MGKCVDYTALTLVIIGAVNWGLIGIFKLDLVNLIFGNMTWISRVIYTLVGLSGSVSYTHLTLPTICSV